MLVRILAPCRDAMSPRGRWSARLTALKSPFSRCSSRALPVTSPLQELRGLLDAMRRFVLAALTLSRGLKRARLFRGLCKRSHLNRDPLLVMAAQATGDEQDAPRGALYIRAPLELLSEEACSCHARGEEPERQRRRSLHRAEQGTQRQRSELLGAPARAGAAADARYDGFAKAVRTAFDDPQGPERQRRAWRAGAAAAQPDEGGQERHRETP